MVERVKVEVSGEMLEVLDAVDVVDMCQAGRLAAALGHLKRNQLGHNNVCDCSCQLVQGEVAGDGYLCSCLHCDVLQFGLVTR
jgi:hypothetical protein